VREVSNVGRRCPTDNIVDIARILDPDLVVSRSSLCSSRRDRHEERNSNSNSNRGPTRHDIAPKSSGPHVTRTKNAHRYPPGERE
jgi:hypothetical protein